MLFFLSGIVCSHAGQLDSWARHGYLIFLFSGAWPDCKWDMLEPRVQGSRGREGEGPCQLPRQCG